MLVEEDYSSDKEREMNSMRSNVLRKQKRKRKLELKKYFVDRPKLAASTENGLRAELISTRNDAYGVVEIYQIGPYEVTMKIGYARDGQRIAWLCIRCLGGAPLHDWRDMQTIKNLLCGKEAQGVEIYPAESDLMDTANNFHLWVYLDGYKLPFGFVGNRAIHDPSLGGMGITPQRPFDVIPEDATDYARAILGNIRFDPDTAPMLPNKPNKGE